MKYYEKKQAILLRKKGLSIGSIAATLGVAKSSVSLWVRDIELTAEQLNHLQTAQHTNEVIEKRRQARLQGELGKRKLVIEEASHAITKISKDELWYIGVMLYWAEGGKTQRMVRFSNGDPQMIQVMLRFFREVCQVPEDKMRCIIHIHSHLDYIGAERYWSGITKLPLSQFYKTYRRITLVPDKKDSLPFGVLDVYVLDVRVFLKIEGWKQGIVRELLGNATLPQA